MPVVNKEHLQIAAVLAASVIEVNHRNTKPGTLSMADALVQCYEAVQHAVKKLERDQEEK